MRRWRKKRKQIQFYRLIICYIIGITIFMGAEGSVCAEEAQAEPLRVILVNYDGYGYIIQDNNEIGGYFVEYLEKIARYTGWKYDYEVVSDEDRLMAITQQKDYDLMVGVPYDEESKRNYFEYPNKELANRRLLLATTKEHSDLTEDALRTKKSIKVGYTKNVHNEELVNKFKSYCFSNGIAYTEEGDGAEKQGVYMVEVPDRERFKLLKAGEIDAVFTVDSLALRHNLYAVADFGTQPLYVVAPKGKTEYIEELNQVFSILEGQGDDYEKRLYEKYFKANYQSRLVFSEEEKAFLTTPRNFVVAMTDYCAPYCYVDNKGEWKGATVEVLNEITRMTEGAFTFSFVRFDNAIAATDAVVKGEADILGLANSSLEIMKIAGNRSSNYCTDYFYLYKNKASKEGLSEATCVIKSDMTVDRLKELGVDSSGMVIKTGSVIDALGMVNSGKADITIALQSVADYYMNYYQWNEIAAVGTPVQTMSFCFAYNASVDSMTRHIFNRCISYVDKEMLDRYIMECILTEHKEYTVGDFIRSHWSLVGMVLLVFFSLASLLLAYIVITLRKKNRRIKHMLNYDDVTGGISRLKFEQEVLELIEDKRERYYIIFADISSFKYINDVFGYAVGNQVLVQVEAFMRRLTKGYPSARMYADHFVGLHSFEKKEAFEADLHRELEAFDKECAERYMEFNVFLKLGIYEWDVLNQPKAELMQIVNLANYATDTIKNLSHSEYRFYTLELHNGILMQQEIESDMHRAMTEGEFVAYYQPKYDILTEQIVGAEALVRWKHKSKGLMSPAVFVPIFEKNGFIIDVDFCVLTQVCKLLAERMEKGKKLYTISCNFSRQHFVGKGFVERMVEIVEQYKVPPCYIEVEITETIATSDFEELFDAVKALKDKGFKISIDDFGSGYSCIQLLYKLPIDVLKFDRVFVLEQNVNKKEADINRSIIQMCHNNGIKVICEGVETSEQREFVKSYDCRYVQGYLYSKPVDEESFVEMLEKGNAE